VERFKGRRRGREDDEEAGGGGMGIREYLCRFYGKLGSAFSKISREGFFLLTFLRGFSKIPREGFFSKSPPEGFFVFF
jgi:hypothetical protein